MFNFPNWGLGESGAENKVTENKVTEFGTCLGAKMEFGKLGFGDLQTSW